MQNHTIDPESEETEISKDVSIKGFSDSGQLFFTALTEWCVPWKQKKSKCDLIENNWSLTIKCLIENYGNMEALGGVS